MSQITRCPSCGTTFKVVADQLRISEGWVRCGQCKEVFDAASQLQAAEPVHLLPDISFDNLQPMKPVAMKAAEPPRVWGSARSPASARAPAAPVVATPPTEQLAASAAPLSPPAPAPLLAEMPAVAVAPQTVVSEPVAPQPPAPSSSSPAAVVDALAVPVRAVPSFLSATQAGDVQAPDWGLEPASPYGWRTREPAIAARQVERVSMPPPAASVPFPDLPVPNPSEAPVLGRADASSPEPGAPGAPDSGGSGYELPFAQLRDSEWPADVAVDDPMVASSEEVERPLAAVLPPQDPDLPDASLAPAGEDGKPPASETSEEEVAAKKTVKRRRLRPVLPPEPAAVEPLPEPAEDYEAPAAPEPGFVRAARRKAFWHSRAMRLALVVCVLLLGVALLLQVALRERDRIASRYPGAAPVLTALCEPLHCGLSAPRQIADVVIDSSSFRRGRGDTYQLAITLKNKAPMALAMPAMELTLTDAQDQPVLRKVLRAQDIAAPSVLSAQGEWSGALSLGLTAETGRVAGYRLLAFYP